MRISLKLLRTLFWILFLSLSNQAMAAQLPIHDNLPTIAEVEVISINTVFLNEISNNADYYFEYTFGGLDTINQRNSEVVATFSPNSKTVIGWSADSAKFAVAFGQTSDYDLGSGILVDIYDTATDTQYIQRLPLTDVTEAGWSPFSGNQVFMNKSILIDIETKQSTVVNNVSPIDLNNTNFIVYGEYIWDIPTQQPIGLVRFITDSRTGTLGYSRAEFQVCTLDEADCYTFLDTINEIRAPVFGWDFSIATRKMLWGAYEVASTTPISRGAAPEDRLDTVLYLTDLATGITDEIFRLSNWNVGNLYIDGLDWSPDGNSIILQSSEFTNQSVYSVLITLQWDDTQQPTP